jgi:hypothetical protein
MLTDGLISQVQVATGTLEATLTLLLVSAMLLIGGAVMIGLVGYAQSCIAWRWVDWQEDRRDEHRYYLLDALRRMQGLGLSPHVIIRLALHEAQQRSTLPSARGWLFAKSQ